MESILLQIEHKKERRQLEDWLSPQYHIVLPNPEQPLEQPFDLAIIDSRSLRSLRRSIRARRASEQPVFLPFLLLTVRRQGNISARHLGRLVDDIIARPLNEHELLARAANLLRMRSWSLELKKEHDRVMKLAITDDVSGFNNTRYLHRYLDRLLEGSATRAHDVCLAFFDVDNFKSLVDAHGHLLGSKALKEIAQTVHKELDEDDRLVRYGGDEFIVILPRQTKQEAMIKVGRMKRAITSTPFLHKEGINSRLTASFGLAAYPQDAKDKHALLAEADRCLFQSKTEGKNRITAVDFQRAVAA